MKPLFLTLGLLLIGYTAVAVIRGEVYAKSGIGGRTFSRAAEPLRYWSAIVVYTLLAVALVCWF
jgi:hypothetical protein